VCVCEDCLGVGANMMADMKRADPLFRWSKLLQNERI